VEFFQGAVLVATDTTAPFTFTLTNVAAGSYTFTARATDNAGAQTTSAAINITVRNLEMFFIHSDHLDTPRVITNQATQVVWRWDQTDPFGGNVPDENPSGLGNFTCNLRLPGQYFDKETNLHYNYRRDYDPAIGRFVEADPLGVVLPGVPTPPRRLNQPYAYADNNPLSNVDPLGLCPCAGGTWDQEIGDFQFNAGAGGYFSVGNVNYTCRSNPSLKCSGKQLSLGAGTPNIGVSWSLGGVVFGAGDSTNLSGWSGSGFFDGWFVGAQGGIFQGQISLSGQGGGAALGSPRGVSAALFRSLNYYMKCNCPTCPPQ